MSDSAQMRARMMQLTLKAIDALPAAQREAIDARIPSEVRRSIEEASRLGWLDYTLQRELNTATLSVLGEESFEAFWLETSTQMAASGALAGLAQGAMRVLGVSPLALYKMFPRGWNHTSRNMGSPEVEFGDDEHSVTIRFVELPPILALSRAWAISNRASVRVMLRLTGRDGAVEMDDSRKEEGIIVFKIVWSPDA